MKLNFLNVLNKKSNPDEIAEQIAALEIKKVQCEQERNKAKNVCKDIRGRVMCGERMSPEAIRNTDRAYDDANLNLEVISDSIEELKRSLYTALETHRQEEEEKVKQLYRKRNEEMEEVAQELAKVKGHLVGLATALYGSPEIALYRLRDVDSFIFQNGQPHCEAFNEERDRAIANLKRPTPADIEDECNMKNDWLANFKIEEEQERILHKYRSKQKPDQPQEQVIEA